MNEDTAINTDENGDPSMAHTVLLIDDEEMVVEVGKAILQRLGYDVITAMSGEEALDQYGQHQPTIACAVLDLTMPGMDGRTTFTRLRELEPQLPIIIASGLSCGQVADQFDGQDQISIIQKPYQVADLAGKIEDLLTVKS